MSLLSALEEDSFEGTYRSRRLLKQHGAFALDCLSQKIRKLEDMIKLSIKPSIKLLLNSCKTGQNANVITSPAHTLHLIEFLHILYIMQQHIKICHLLWLFSFFPSLWKLRKVYFILLIYIIAPTTLKREWVTGLKQGIKALQMCGNHINSINYSNILELMNSAKKEKKCSQQKW